VSLASKLGKYSGIIAAELVWVFETGWTPGVVGMTGYALYVSAENIAQEHAIDNTDPETVTNNIFDCLDFID